MSNSFIKNASYTVLDWVTFGKGVRRTINGMKVRFPARWSRYYKSVYEPDTYKLLKHFVKPGAHIIDIGAHIGLFTTCISQLVGPNGKIICFEPTPETFSILKETLRLNHCDNVIPVQAAVSDKNGSATFYASSADEACNSNSLVKNRAEKDLSAYDVKLVTIDSIVEEYSVKPSLIKIDVEGAELDTLKGGVETFRNFKPLIILGLHPAFIKQKGDSLEAIWDLLLQCGYEMKLDGKTITRDDFCSRDILFDVHCYSS